MNRQLRNPVFILYPDNDKHLKAIDILKNENNSLLIKHIEEKTDSTGNLHKEHYHCILWFDNPSWISSICNHLGLDDTDYHLFKSIKEFKRFKNIDDYIIYLTHVFENNKPDKYDIDDFIGGRVDYAKQVLSNFDKPDYIRLYELTLFIKQYNIDNFIDTRMFSFSDWFKVAIDNGYGDVFYKQWYKMRDILKPYIYY